MAEDGNNTGSIERAIGKLEGKMEEVLRLQRESSESRARLYEGQEKVREEVHDLNGRMEAVEKAIGIMDPLVKDFGRLKERWRGIVLVLAIIWLLVGGVVVNALQWLGGLLMRAVGGN